MQCATLHCIYLTDCRVGGTAVCAACRYSIHSSGSKADLKAAVDRYPEPVKGAEGVYYCGYNSEKSYGGSAWLVVREGGNVMIDSPRFDPKLVKRVKV
jgi:hypothetical protein